MGYEKEYALPVRVGRGTVRSWIILISSLLSFLGILVWRNADARILLPFGLGFGLSSDNTEEWRWSKILPTKDLTWHPCFEKYDCAKLDVPLDWLEPSEDLRASIAIIRLNATDRENYRGPVFINPGGPGGSGIWFVKRLGAHYQAVVGQNHDIISFDPRGVGASTPHISCWDSVQSSEIWGLKEVDVVDAHPGVVSDAYAHSTAFSQQCASLIGGGNLTSGRAADPKEKGLVEAGPGRFVSTASTARDLLEIATKAGEDKLKYWGFSYGTVLGIVFASMFPEKVGRMVNDGNVDVRQYTSGLGTHFIQDTDKVMDAFYHFCHLAGPEKCAVYERFPNEIEARIDILLANIKKSPVVVTATPPGPPNIISYSEVRRMQTSALYQPLVLFSRFAQALADLEARDGRHFMELSGQGLQNTFTCHETTGGPAIEDLDLEATADASNAILCSDGGLHTDTVDDLQLYVDGLVRKSKAAGATMAGFKLSCIGWSVEAKWRYTGPFTGNTSTPILFVANKADNVTPLRSALENARGFKDSVILIQNSVGHTSLSAPSRCTAKTIRAYFQNGTLPAPGTVCEADLVPFDTFEVPSPKGVTNEPDEELDRALLNLMFAPIPLV